MLRTTAAYLPLFICGETPLFSITLKRFWILHFVKEIYFLFSSTTVFSHSIGQEGAKQWKINTLVLVFHMKDGKGVFISPALCKSIMLLSMQLQKKSSFGNCFLPFREPISLKTKLRTACSFALF